MSDHDARRGMTVVVNGQTQQVPEGLSIRGLLAHLSLTDGPVAVEKNGEVVPRARHDAEPVVDGDVLEIVHFVGGG